MTVTCEACGRTYDDTYRWTICPHERFQMRTVVADAKGNVGVATTVEELSRLVGEEADRLPPPGDYGPPKWLEDIGKRN